MREANWDEIFQRRTEEAPKQERLNSVVPWEDWLTFAIAAVVFMSVVASIDGANWVDEMPSLYPIGFSALLVGYAISRIRASELLLHPLALAIGTLLVYLQLIAIVPGGSLVVRTENLIDRMREWWWAVTNNGISTDELPFITITLVFTWLGAYISSWAIFRWKNPWLGLVPGGIALMWNISFIPGQFSFAFVVFVFGAVLLLMRMHVARKEEQWDRDEIVYQEFISLNVLNATFWVAVVLLSLAWLMPLAERSDSANERWENFIAPVTERFAPLGRVFISVNAKKPIAVHNLKDALAFQGQIKLSSKDAVEIDVTLSPEMAAFLREQSFDEYTSEGWRINVTGDIELPAGERTNVDEGVDETSGARQEVTVNVTVEGGNNENLFSVGQPVASDQPADVKAGDSASDVARLEPATRLRNGDIYSVTGSVNVASIEQLRAAGSNYPAGIEGRYLQIPPSLPERVVAKAQQVIAGEETPYDQATAIERYLRTFPVDYDMEGAPAGQDNVDYFLFDAQRGYFDYHASAMAVMLRSLGIPARVATGYVIDPFQRQGDSTAFKLTEKQAFAWPEVYFPGIGWVEFSPTPSEPLINRPGIREPEPAVPPGREATDDPPIELEIPGAENPVGPVADVAQEGRGMWPMIIALSVLGAIVVVAIAGARFAWGYGLAGLPLPAQIWEKTLRLAAIGKTPAQPNETPREFAARLRRDVAGADAAGYLAATYERNRFGHKELTEDETERIEGAWSALRASLLRRALRLRRKDDGV